jgi:hypothetical protein
MAFGIDDAIAAGLKIIDKFIPDPAEKAKAAAAFEQEITSRETPSSRSIRPRSSQGSCSASGAGLWAGGWQGQPSTSS